MRSAYHNKYFVSVCECVFQKQMRSRLCFLFKISDLNFIHVLSIHPVHTLIRREAHYLDTVNVFFIFTYVS